MAVPPIDPTALALLSIFGGVALTIIAGGIGALFQRAHEKNKWLRDQRLRVYTEFLAAHDGLVRVNAPGEEGPTEPTVLQTVGAIQLVGPYDVSLAARKLNQVMLGMVASASARRAAGENGRATDEEVAEAASARGEFMRLAQQYVQKR